MEIVRLKCYEYTMWYNQGKHIQCGMRGCQCQPHAFYTHQQLAILNTCYLKLSVISMFVPMCNYIIGEICHDFFPVSMWFFFSFFPLLWTICWRMTCAKQYLFVVMPCCISLICLIWQTTADCSYRINSILCCFFKKF